MTNIAAVMPRAAARASESDFNCAAHGLRGLASVLVFYAHIIYGPSELYYSDSPQLFENLRPAYDFARYGVELFFVISGFVILPSVMRYNPAEFTLRRFFRIYPLFLASSLIFIMYNTWSAEYPKVRSAEAIIAGLLFLNIFTHTEQLAPNAWSLTFEVMYYALACCAVYVTVRNRNIVLAALVYAACVAFLVAFPISAFFLCGGVIRWMHDRNPVASSPSLRGAESIAAVCCVLFASQGYFVYTHDDLLRPLPYLIFFSTAVYFYCATIPGSLTSLAFSNKLAVYLGTVSYSLYLVHPYTYRAVRYVFQSMNLFTESWALSMSLFAVLVTIVTMVATHWAHRWFEVVPYQWFFRTRVYRT